MPKKIMPSPFAYVFGAVFGTVLTRFFAGLLVGLFRAVEIHRFFSAIWIVYRDTIGYETAS